MLFQKFLFLLLSFVSFSSCSEKEDVLEGMKCIETTTDVEIETDTTNTTSKRKIKYLALGDSYTIGENESVSGRWPNQLKDSLTLKGFVVEKTDIIAQTGWTTTNLLNAINNTLIEDYNLVSLLIGVNNQYQNKPFSLFKQEFNQLLDTAIVFAGSKDSIFVVSIPDYGVTPFGGSNSQAIAQEIDMYNDYIESQCDSLAVTYINITEISRNLGSSNGALTNDNLHPSAFQYSKWVEAILPRVLAMIE